MSFTKKLQGFIDKTERKWDERRHPQPPPVPTASKPKAGFPGGGYQRSAPPPPLLANEQPPQIYWQPNLHPQVPVSANFQHEKGQHGWGNNEAQNYVDALSNSFHSVDGTALIVRAIINSAQPNAAQRFTSARLSSHQTLARGRGCLSARITAPVAKGIWPAFWLLPKDPFKWPNDGEIDIMEAWNGDIINHSCLHWGFFNGEDHDKHRVLETPVPGIGGSDGVKYDFAWDVDDRTGYGRLLWVIDGRAVMRAEKPRGTRPISDFRILINIAVGGNVCEGHMPRDGAYEAAIRELAMWDAPPGGWAYFDRAWNEAPEGHVM